MHLIGPFAYLESISAIVNNNEILITGSHVENFHEIIDRNEIKLIMRPMCTSRYFPALMARRELQCQKGEKISP